MMSLDLQSSKGRNSLTRARANIFPSRASTIILDPTSESSPLARIATFMGRIFETYGSVTLNTFNSLASMCFESMQSIQVLVRSILLLVCFGSRGHWYPSCSHFTSRSSFHFSDHSGFMCALKSAGIYVIVELGASCQDCAILGQQAPTCYPGGLKERGQFVINVFAKYENVIAFSAGNEVQLFPPGQPLPHNAPCQKQFLRDMRAYIDSCPNLRKIPVGVVVADFFRDENALYYNCRSDASDELENAEWYGINVYLHCDGSATTIDDLTGYQGLLQSHKNYSMSIPVVLTEFGCPNSGFPTIDGFEGQRNWLQIDALFSPEYEEYFAGGIAFEFSAEKSFIENLSYVEYPFSQYSRYNFGLGYYVPEECDDIYTPCSFTPYPTFEILASKYAAVNASGQPDLDSYDPGNLDVTECPSIFPPLSSFTWESETVEDMDCVGPNYVYVCPNTAPECLPPFAVSAPAASPPTVAPSASETAATTTMPTIASSVAPNETPVPSEVPNDTASPTGAPVLETEEPPTESPNDTPTPSEAPLLATDESPTDEPQVPMSTSAPSLPLALRPVAFKPTGSIFQATSSASGVFLSTWMWSSGYVLLLCLFYR